MHKWAKAKAESLKNEIDAIGCDNITLEQVEKAKGISEMLKNMVCLDKDAKIIDAMDESEKEENMDMIEKFTDYPVRNYSRMRRRYSKPWEEEYDVMDRDMDRNSMNRMYYSNNGMNNMAGMNNGSNGMSGMNNSRDPKEGRSGYSRKRYYESKENSTKEITKKDAEKYIDDVSTDLLEMLQDAMPEIKTMALNKLQVDLIDKVARL